MIDINKQIQRAVDHAINPPVMWDLVRVWDGDRTITRTQWRAVWRAQREIHRSTMDFVLYGSSVLAVNGRETT